MKLCFSLIFFLTCSEHIFSNVIRGRYTREITNYEVVLPRKVKPNGAFHSFSLPHFYSSHLRKKRSLDEDDKVHYQVGYNGAKHHLELTPNVDLTGPGLVVETWYSMTNLSSMDIQRPRRHLCHYLGKVRGHANSRVALSGCDGLAGHIVTDNGSFLIEPLHGEEVQKNGEHLHAVYKSSLNEGEVYGTSCGTHNDNWLELWARDLFKAKMKAIENGQGLKSLKKRQTVESVPRYIACGIVCDKLFMDFHADIDKEEYVLTVMNIVRGYYHDQSVGFNVNIVVTKLVFMDIEKGEVKMKVVKLAGETLESFCKWQMTFNHDDWNHPNHYDIAILFTRFNLCLTESDCGLLGLAYTNKICDTEKNCCVNEDAGLNLGIVVTHEMGHLLGSSHDEPSDNGCSGVAVEPDAKTVMHPVADLWTTNWSNCTREVFTMTFNSELGDCLFDEPKDQKYKMSNLLPGAVYGHEFQCQMDFGRKSKACKLASEDLCEKLWCTAEDSGKCTSRGTIAIDGTTCGPDKWCYKKKCVEKGSTPGAINGGWGDWGPWSKCTRTCGAGVELRERLCDKPKPAHRGKYCLGTAKEFAICNTQPCDAKSPSFRALQCSAFDGKPVPEVKAIWKTWKPHSPPVKDPAPCKLYCTNEKNKNTLVKWRVEDGTRCRPGTKDTCVQGKCEKVGCDWKVNSKAVEDVCGICNGDGTHCTAQTIKFTDPPKKKGATVVACKIPKNSSNIVIKEGGPSMSYLVAGPPGMKKMYLPLSLDREPGEYMFGEDKAIFAFSRRYQEEVYIKGPTLAEIHIYYGFKEENNPGVTCTFVTEDRNPNTKPVYEWDFITWNECSVRCGSGTEISNPNCVEKIGGKVSDSFCNQADKPEPQSRACNEEPCGTHWKVWKWGPCSGCQDKPGERKREVECVMENPTVGVNEDIIVEASKCCGEVPIKTEPCTSSSPCETKKKRRADRLDTEFMKYNMNTSDLEEYKDKFFKRTADKRPVSEKKDFVFVDILPQSSVHLSIANLSECKGDPMKLSEEDYESEGQNVPIDVPISVTELHGKEAIAAINEIRDMYTTQKTTIKPTKS